MPHKLKVIEVVLDIPGFVQIFVSTRRSEKYQTNGEFVGLVTEKDELLSKAPIHLEIRYLSS